jgi:hypothetical protein
VRAASIHSENNSGVLRTTTHNVQYQKYHARHEIVQIELYNKK